jgi:WD repeat-containing protein 70
LGRQAKRRSWILHGLTRTNEVLLWRCVQFQYSSQDSDYEAQSSHPRYDAQADLNPPSGSSIDWKTKAKSSTPTVETEHGDEEPEFDPFDQEEADQSQFPITHEIILKDHTKVVSALTLDPSGARVLSGSHDYDCKLWDFGGMDARCKPFKSWEPSGTYYVGHFPFERNAKFYCYLRYTT